MTRVIVMPSRFQLFAGISLAIISWTLGIETFFGLDIAKQLGTKGNLTKTIPVVLWTVSVPVMLIIGFELGESL